MPFELPGDTADVSIRPTIPVAFSANHSAPSGPTVIPSGPLLAVGVGNSPTSCPVVGSSSPILLAPNSVNQRLPSGPVTMPDGCAPAVSPGPEVGYSVIVPSTATR